MTTIDIKKFFKAIRGGNLQKVTEFVSSNREYLTATNFAPPKKDDGQSGLQASFTTANFDIAEYLIEQGANINFIATSKIEKWNNTSALHTCVEATMLSCYTLQKDTKQFDKAFSLLQLMLSKGANPNTIDYDGNNCLHEALLYASQMFDHPCTDLTNNILIQQLQRVFTQLIRAGADPKMIQNNRGEMNAEELCLHKGLDKYNLW